MPVYEYECQGCGKVLEVQQKIADAPLACCPECNGEVRKLVSMSSFQLKGGGWYADGYASSSSEKSSNKDSDKTSTPTPKKEAVCSNCPAAAAATASAE